MKASLDPSLVKLAISIARTIKPTSGDLALSFSNGRMRVWSYDNKFGHFRSAVGSVRFLDGNIESEDEFYIPLDRVGLFETDLSSMSMSLTDKGLSVKFEGTNRSRSAVLKRRSGNSKRPRFPNDIDTSGFFEIRVDLFDDFLRQISCSALVRETKTEEDMGVNQVHFYEGGWASSNARFYATLAQMNGFDADLSIVSSDIPAIRSFCSKSGESVLFGFDSKCFKIFDPKSKSWITFSRRNSKKPSLSLPDSSHNVSIEVSKDDIQKSVKWCVMALDGTQRVTLSVGEDSIRMLSGTSELSKVPAKIDGSPFTTDLPVKVLSTICDHLSDGPVSILFGNKSMPEVVEFTQPGSPVLSRHFVKGMRTR